MATVKDVNRIPQLIKEFGRVNRRRVEVGIFKDAPKLVAIGTINEFGTRVIVTRELATKLRIMAKENGYSGDLPQEGEEMIIPERSFLRAAFDEYAAQVSKDGGELLASVAAGEIDDAYEALKSVGVLLQKAVIDRVARGTDMPPNHPLTIAIKGHSRPLVGKTGVLETTQGIRVRVVWV